MKNLFDKYKSIVETAFLNSENNFSKINDEIINMEGMTGTKTRHFYNNLLNFEDARYLEIGTWKGSSVCSAMFNNNATVLCMDNWRPFASISGSAKETFLYNFNKFKGQNHAQFIEANCFKVDISNFPKFNIYLFDGEHDEENHYNALSYYKNCLDDIFIFIVDDWNWDYVRNGTKKAINDLKLNILYEKEIKLTNDNTHTPKDIAKNTWWNGIYVSILQK
jgi:hypothetical protein